MIKGRKLCAALDARAQMPCAWLRRWRSRPSCLLFVTIGLSSAWFQPSTRSALFNELLPKSFELDSLTFFAGKFGLETVKTAKSALECTEIVHS